MENAVDALKMAAAILIFIIALATSFSIFGTAKETADSIITMRDKQAYLAAAELDDGILYTSSSAIQGDTTGLTDEQIKELMVQESNIGGVTKNGDRIVKADDIISTIYRYSKEKYGVTIIDTDGTVLARFDSSTENVMQSQWAKLKTATDTKTGKLNSELYEEEIKKQIQTIYVDNIKLDLEDLFKYTVTYKDEEGETKTREVIGAPWFGSVEDINKRIAAEVNGETYQEIDDVGTKLSYTNENLKDKLDNANQIVEVTNEIDKTNYLQDKDEEGNKIVTNLPQQYNMPTIEIVYIILN